MTAFATFRRFFLLMLLVLSPSAHAIPYYFEFGGTLANWSNPSAVFTALEKGASDSTSGTFGVPMTFGVQLQERQRGLLFSIAIQNRYLAGQTGAGESFVAMPTGPMFRLEFWRLVLGVGYSIHVWKDITFSKAAGIDNALTFEGQFLFPITPEIDFGLQAAQVTFNTATASSKVLEYGAFFRLNFGFTEAARNERRKYKGWRYPLGSPLKW